MKSIVLMGFFILAILSASGQKKLKFKMGEIENQIRLASKGIHKDNAVKAFILNTGTDNIPPVVQHNPVKMIAKCSPFVYFSAIAKDNLGISTVEIEYKIDGETQNPLILSNDSADFFSTKFILPVQLTAKSKLEYRIIAEDKSAKRNKRILPAVGFYTVEIFNAQNPVIRYQSDFNSETNDFVTNDFVISTQPGFSSGILQSVHPYPLSNIEDRKYNLIAQLVRPIILQKKGTMSFDEVVMVEPGLPASSSTSPIFWDYVIVEGSKDKGETWDSFSPEYDSHIEECWASSFNSSIANGCSKCVPEESMLKKHVISLTENTIFSADDTVLIRFRLASDQTINGWGWAIDNLEIQTVSTAINDLITANNFNVYPNPFSNSVSIDCVAISNNLDVEILIHDLMGRNVYCETWYKVASNVKKQIDLAELKSGIYLLSLNENNSTLFRKKIVKN